MGLAIVAAIVSGHQGVLTVNSEPGHGTQMIVDLPLQAELTAAAEASFPRSMTATTARR
jgi:signal transduction histidine kinase